MLIRGSDTLSLLGAAGLTLFIYGIEEIIFSGPQRKYLRRATHFLEFATTLLAFLLTVLFFYGMLSSPAWLKLLQAAWFVFVSMVEYGYQKVLRRFAVAGDVEIGLISPPGMWKDAGALYFDPRVFITLTVVAGVLWLVDPRSSWQVGLLACGILLTVTVGLNHIQRRLAYRLNRGPTALQAMAALLDFARMRLRRVQRKKLSLHLSDRPGKNIVLIVDESLRADHLSVNGYARATTPHLEAISKAEDFFHNWGVAVPGATCSNISNGLLGTGARIEPGSLDGIYRHPTMFQYARAMGYRTFYIDVQTSYLWNGIGQNDLVYIDEWFKSTEFGEDNLNSDFRAAERLHAITANSTGSFIVLNKRGVHFLYESNYPPAAAVWMPTPARPADYESHPELTTNAYDNAILYNVDGFFRRLFPEAGRMNEYTRATVFLYTSDHGETLYEDGSRVTHCSGTRQETRVPLIIFGQLPVAVDTAYRARHSNILPTILDLLHTPSGAYPYPYDLSLLTARAEDSTDRLFFDSDGTILNHDQMERTAAISKGS